MGLYRISQKDFEKLEKELHLEMSRMLHRYIMVMGEEAPDVSADQRPEWKKKLDKEAENITIAGQKRRGRPKRNS